MLFWNLEAGEKFVVAKTTETKTKAYLKIEEKIDLKGFTSVALGSGCLFKFPDDLEVIKLDC